MADGRGRATTEISKLERRFRRRDWAVFGKGMCSHTTLNIEDVMFVQRPATEVGRVQLKSLKDGCPFLPQD